MTIFAAFKRLVIFILALLGFLVIVNRAARAETVIPTEPIWKQSDSYALIVAQKKTQSTGNDSRAPSSESKESDSKTDEKKDSTGAKKKPLKDFKPSEKIEAEQAVDFPYDI